MPITYKIPLINLKHNMVQKSMAKLEITVTTKPAINVGLITRFLPLVSAKKPHKCELIIMPT